MVGMVERDQHEKDKKMVEDGKKESSQAKIAYNESLAGMSKTGNKEVLFSSGGEFVHEGYGEAIFFSFCSSNYCSPAAASSSTKATERPFFLLLQFQLLLFGGGEFVHEGYREAIFSPFAVPGIGGRPPKRFMGGDCTAVADGGGWAAVVGGGGYQLDCESVMEALGCDSASGGRWRR
nr:hypothetical protein Iba_chr08eCG7100 [Ipomoea batatas]